MLVLLQCLNQTVTFTQFSTARNAVYTYTYPTKLSVGKFVPYIMKKHSVR